MASGLAGAAAGVNKFLTSGVSHNCPMGWDDIPPPQFAVFTVVREEQPYIEEFVMYHLFIGVDIIYIYGAAWWLGWGWACWRLAGHTPSVSAAFQPNP